MHLYENFPRDLLSNDIKNVPQILMKSIAIDGIWKFSQGQGPVTYFIRCKLPRAIRASVDASSMTQEKHLQRLGMLISAVIAEDCELFD